MPDHSVPELAKAASVLLAPGVQAEFRAHWAELTSNLGLVVHHEVNLMEEQILARVPAILESGILAACNQLIEGKP